MKKSLFMMLLLGLCFSISLSATNNPEVKPNAKTVLVKDKVITLRLTNLQKQVTHIELTDLHENEKYFTDVVRKHNGYAKQLNLKKLQDGTYLIKVRNGGDVIQQVLRIKGDKVLFSKFAG